MSMEIIEAPVKENYFLAPAAKLEDFINRYNMFNQFVKSILKPGIDYMEIPGTNKPSLVKPGAEKLCTLFGLTSRQICTDRVEDWTGKDHDGEPFFKYDYRCELYHGERFIASCDGSCNSFEKKYRYRWMNELEVPAYIDKTRLEYKDGSISEFKFAVDKAETSGRYGKPAEYWKQFHDALANGTARIVQKKGRDKVMEAVEIGGKVYAVPNHDIADQVNTIQKMAQKRSFVGAVLIATNASEYFTQDMEDIAMRESAIDGAFVPETTAPAAQQSQPKTQAPAATASQSIPFADDEFVPYTQPASASRTTEEIREYITELANKKYANYTAFNQDAENAMIRAIENIFSSHPITQQKAIRETLQETLIGNKNLSDAPIPMKVALFHYVNAIKKTVNGQAVFTASADATAEMTSIWQQVSEGITA